MEHEFIDQFSDPSFKVLFEAFSSHPETEPFIKKASIDPEENAQRPDSAFAWQERRMFPIDDPHEACLSRLYMSKQAGIPKHVVERCDKALEVYGVKFPIDTKQASEARDEDFLLPGKKRFFVNSPETVKMADEALARIRRQLSFEERVQASVNLVKQAVEHKVRPSPQVFKEAGLTMCNTGYLKDWVEARACATDNVVCRDAFLKIAEALPKTARLESDRDDLIKVAVTLSELDDLAKLRELYDVKIPNPMLTVFNTDKLADEMVQIGGTQIPLETLLQVDPEVYKDVFGPDVVEEFVDASGVIDPEQFKVILATVPLDLQKTLVAQLGLH